MSNALQFLHTLVCIQLITNLMDLSSGLCIQPTDRRDTVLDTQLPRGYYASTDRLR
jgi:hypothetical protein